MTQPLILIGGPTASGKSGLAVALAEAFRGTVINADSMQVYRDLRILTNRPGPDEEAKVPHRLFGCLDAADPCSAARWRDLAEEALAEARGAGRLPILVGGTGLYFRALLDGLAEIPPIPDEIRQAARALHAELGGAAFREELAALDPETAARLPPGDTQRLIRAYEVAAATGRTLGEWQQEAAPFGPREERRIATLLLLPPRDVLYRTCDARLEEMLRQGVLEEVGALMARHLDPALPALKAVGFREFARHLEGELSLEAALAAAQQATRNYAKRQMTWFRHQLPDAHPVPGQFSERILPEILAFIREFLLTL
jgi:tRNA dimethylallyltransferase